MVDIKQKVLVLGAGLVSTPLVEYLSRDKSVQLTTGTRFMYVKSLQLSYYYTLLIIFQKCLK